MPPQFQKGDRVRTKDFGAGTVVSVFGESALVELSDIGGLELQIALDDLALEDGVSPAVPPSSVVDTILAGAAEHEAISGDTIVGRRVIEALRFGLVPSSSLDEITVGFSELSPWITDRLKLAGNGTPTLSEVSGAFGTGKSHTMAVVRMLAERENFVTAHVEIDGQSISLADPERLLERLWSTLRADGMRSSTPLLDLYQKAEGPLPKMCKYGIDRIRDNYRMVKMLDRHGCLDKYAHSLDAVISSSRELPASKVSNEVARDPKIAAYDVCVRRMIGLRVVDRPLDFIRAIAGHATIARSAGYRGLAVTMDEFEVEYLGGRIDRVIQVVAALANYLAGEEECPAAPLAIFVASVGQEGHLGDRLLDIVMDRAGGERHALEPLCTADRHRLVETIHELYMTAYELTGRESRGLVARLDEEAEGMDAAESGLVRALIKKCVALCDAEYGPPSNGRVA